MVVKVSSTLSSEVIRIDINTPEHAISLAKYLERKKVGIVTQITIYPDRRSGYILIRANDKGAQAITEIEIAILDF